MPSRWHGYLVVLVVAMAAWTRSAPAAAYGALASDADASLAQTAARVVLADNGDGTTTAVIELAYEGEADRFGWVLPVPGTPEVGIASSAALDRLESTTGPVYQLDTVAHGTCLAPQAIASAWPPVSAGERRVAAFDVAEAWPFEYLVVTADSTDGDPIDRVEQWLAAGDVVAMLDRAVLESYLDAGRSLLAVRLKNDHPRGVIRPLLLRYPGHELVLPLRATAGTAASELSLLVWVLGAERAVPTNYASIELDETRIDWFEPATSYQALVAEAVDEAGGRAFVTELSAPAAPIAESLLIVTREQWQALQVGEVGQAAAFIDASVLVFGEWDGFEDVVRAHAPGSEALTREELFACISCVIDDVAAFATDLTVQVVEPVFAVHDLLRVAATVTRLYTRIDAEDMGVDPSFDFNPELEEVPLLHVAEGAYTCDDRFAVVVPQGNLVRGAWGAWPASDDLPAARRIVQHGSSGQGELLTDNGDAIDDAWPPTGGGDAADAGSTGSMGLDGDAGDPDPGAQASARDDGSSCAATGPRGGRRPKGLALFLLSLGALSRRRRSVPSGV